MLRVDGLRNRPATAQEPGGAPKLTALLAIGVAFGLLCYTDISLTRDAGRIAVVWIPNALLLAFLLRGKGTSHFICLPFAFAGNVIANTLAGDALPQALGLSFANSLEIGLIWWGMRHARIPRPDMSVMRDLITLTVIGGVAAPAISGAVAACVLGAPTPAGMFGLWWSWALTDALGILIVTPTALVLAESRHRWRRPPRARAIEAMVLFAIATVAATYIFWQTRFPFLFLATPILLVFAFRFGSAGTAVAVLEVAVIASVGTAMDLGPIHLVKGGFTAHAFVLQTFLVCNFAVGFPVAAALAGKKRLEEELRLLANNATDAVFRLTLAGDCIYASPSAQTLLGIPADLLIGQRLLARFHPDDDANVHDRFVALAQGTIKNLVVAYRSERVDMLGVYVWLEAHAGLIRDASGEPAEILVSVRDVSANKALEAELVEARERAENAADAKAAFLANMSHEIRTPMNGVLGFTELLQRSPLTPEQHGHVDLIAESGRSMMRLLNNILDMSKIDAGQMSVARETVDIRHTLNNAVRLMQASAAAKGLSLTVEVDPSVPHYLTGDELRLRQIVLNLIGNAIKFTGNGAIALSARCEGSADGNRHLAVAVSDSGVGIEPDRLSMIFDQFAQADSSIARKYGGTGLGLAISSDLAGLMGGAIDVASTVGQGSIFTLRVPFIESTGTVTAEVRTADAAVAQPAASCRVLIAEDHDINQQLILALTSAAGFHAEIACDGSQAVDMVLAADDAGMPYDLVLMDVQMPVTDGLSATRQLRALGFGPDVLPVVALTANAYAEDIQACLSAGMQAHLPKPVRLHDLQRTVAKYARSIGAAPVVPQSTQPATSDATEALARRYRERRRDTLDAVSAAVREGKIDGATVEMLASMLHKLAGTAAFFGEESLGDAALKMEGALKSATSGDLARIMANGLATLKEAA